MAVLSDVWMELEPEEPGGLPGLMVIDGGPGVKEDVLSKLGLEEGKDAKVITRDRAVEIQVLSFQAEGYSLEEAKALALEEIEEWEA